MNSQVVYSGFSNDRNCLFLHVNNFSKTLTFSFNLYFYTVLFMLRVFASHDVSASWGQGSLTLIDLCIF